MENNGGDITDCNFDKITKPYLTRTAKRWWRNKQKKAERESAFVVIEFWGKQFHVMAAVRICSASVWFLCLFCFLVDRQEKNFSCNLQPLLAPPATLSKFINAFLNDKNQHIQCIRAKIISPITKPFKRRRRHATRDFYIERWWLIE